MKETHSNGNTNANGLDSAHPMADHARTTTPHSNLAQTSKNDRGWIAWLWSPGTSTPIPAHLSLAALRIALTAFFLGTLAGLVLPQAVHIFANLIQWARRVPLELETEVRSNPFSYTQLHFYLLAWSTFHLLEFVITARYNRTRLFADSFLISNGITYHLAHLFGLLEFILEARFASKEFKSFAWYNVLGLSMILIGQTIRSLAMVHCADNFSHEVATRKREDHKLVTDGIYRISRHPSYAGFFYWALGTQIMLGNPVSVCVFTVILWRFFRFRIKDEEVHLTYFFGKSYNDFRTRTPTLIPFIS